MIRCCEDDRRSDGGRRPQPGRDPVRWQARLEELLGRVAGRFGRVAPRRRARAFVYGLLADLAGKNCWTIAEHPGTEALMGCSTCWGGRCGTTTGSAMTSAPTWSSTWPTRGGAGHRRDRRPQEGHPVGGSAAPEHRHRRPGRERPGRLVPAVRRRCRARHDRPGAVCARGWIRDPDRCRAAGILTQVGFATKPALATQMLAAPWTPGCRSPGSPATRSTAPTQGGGPSWSAEGSARCWRWPATTRWSPPATATAPTPCSGGCRRGPGSACRPARAPRATVCTTGRS